MAYLANNPNAQYIQAGPGALATAGRNTLGTPPINNWDFAIMKRVNITERQALTFQFQAANIFNHAQYVPGVISDVESFGQASDTIRNALITGSPTFNQWAGRFHQPPASDRSGVEVSVLNKPASCFVGSPSGSPFFVSQRLLGAHFPVS